MNKHIRGVNLGGWLVLEKWMTPQLFEGMDAKDETDYTATMTEEQRQRLLRHRESFITREDIGWIADAGINTLRLPIPHWFAGDTPPYLGCIEEMKRLFGWAEEFGLDVMVDLHCAPGCQNGFDNGGISGVMNWHKDPANLTQTLAVLEQLCALCKPYRCVKAIELLNEPHWEVPLAFVQDFYRQGYAIVRRWYAPGECTVVMHDSFRMNVWGDFMREDKWQDILMDVHPYHFPDEHIPLDYFGHARLALTERNAAIQALAAQHDTVVGEWSLGYPPAYVDALTVNQREVALRGLAANQLAVYEQTRGWIFWSYKVLSDMPAWSYRTCVEKGWMPRWEAEE